MKITKFILTGILLTAVICSNRLYAQTDSLTAAEPPNKAKGGETKFLLAGKAAMSWTNTSVDGSPNSHTFFPDAFMLMPLVKVNKHLFLDAQVEVDVNPNPGGGASINLIEMIAYYRIHPLVNFFFGNFSPKYGLYMGVLDDFTNRYGSGPIGMGRGPQTQTGIGIQGGIQAGYSKFNYQIYLSNGPQLIVDSTGANHGQLEYGNYSDNNNNKAIGGSIGFLPFSNSSLQIDVSGQYAAKTGNAGTAFENISSTSWAADLNYYHVFNPIMIRVLAEYNNTQTQNVPLYTDATNTTLIQATTFTNQHSGWFTGATIRASGSQSTFLSNLELGGRIGAYTAPKGALWDNNAMNGTPMNQTTVCLTYWFTWKTPLNFFYDIYTQDGNPTQKVFTVRTIFFF